jgi:DNA-binding NarL/FixJ family response regulator
MNAFPLRRSGVLVVHEDPLLCAGLVAALRQHAHFDVYLDGVDALPRGPTSIDVVIADYHHGLRLADAEERAALGIREARVLVLTANDREVDVRRAVEAGVYGYLLAGGPLSELIDAVTTVANGVRHLSAAVAQRIAESLTRASLTSREMDVLKFVVVGVPNKVIARELRIEVGTVKSHMRGIMAKLGAASRTEAAGIATARGLVDPAPLPQRSTHPVGGAIAARAARMWSIRRGATTALA